MARQSITSYASMNAWRSIQQFLPEENRINDHNRPEETWWEWNGGRIHMDIYPNPSSRVRIMLLHGVGGNGRLLSFAAVPLHRAGYEVISPDLPGYGLSRIKDRKFTYDHWIRMTVDLMEAERSKDGRPFVLFGLSAGGMLAYQAACMHREVKGLIATCILDQRIREVREGSAAHPFMGRAAVPLLQFLNGAVPGIRFPMKMVAKMRAIVNNKDFLVLLLGDKTSSGVRVPVSFLYTLMTTAPEIEPEHFVRCPFLLVHPAKDLWTPVGLSRLFYDRLACEKKLVLLENAGHFPIEQPGLGQMGEAIISFISGLA